MAYSKNDSVMLFDRRGNSISGTVLRTKKDGSLRIRGEDGKKYRRSPSEVRDLPENWEELKKTMPYKPSKSKSKNSPETPEIREVPARELTPEEIQRHVELSNQRQRVLDLMKSVDKGFSKTSKGISIEVSVIPGQRRVQYRNASGDWCKISVDSGSISSSVSISGNYHLFPEVETFLAKHAKIPA